LGAEAANTITEPCPNFAELLCDKSPRDTAAEDSTAFILAFRLNRLPRFNEKGGHMDPQL
jgi:hypothetical protein